MSNEVPRSPVERPLQKEYKRDVQERIQEWREIVALSSEKQSSDELQTMSQFLEHVITSVERDDRLTAEAVIAPDIYVPHYYFEDPGFHGQGSGNAESPMEYRIRIDHMEGLFSIFKAGKNAAVKNTY